MPLPSSRKPIANRKIKGFEFLKSDRITRAEMVRKVGEPDAYYDDVWVAFYRINEVRVRELWLFLLVFPLGGDSSQGLDEMALVQFDEYDRAQRFSVCESWKDMGLSARAWAKNPAEKPKAALNP